jgi:hypothetical protein
VVARFKDDGYSAFKEIRRDDFVNLIGVIERDEIDVVIIRDVDRLTRNLPDWSRFEKAAIEHRVILSASIGSSHRLSDGAGVRDARPRHRRVMSVYSCRVESEGLGGPGGVPGVVRAGGCDAGLPGRLKDPDGEDRGCQEIWLWPSGRFRRIL